MPPEDAHIPTMIERFCNAWAWACLGFMLGFAACAMLNEAGYSKQSLGIVFWLLACATAFISILPRTILEIVRRLRRFRRLAA
jgi:hypothetical protein